MDIINNTSDTFIILGKVLPPEGSLSFDNSEYGNPILRETINKLYEDGKIEVSSFPNVFPYEEGAGYIQDPPGLKRDGDTLVYDELNKVWITNQPTDPLINSETYELVTGEILIMKDYPIKLLSPDEGATIGIISIFGYYIPGETAYTIPDGAKLSIGLGADSFVELFSAPASSLSDLDAKLLYFEKNNTYICPNDVLSESVYINTGVDQLTDGDGSLNLTILYVNLT